MVGVFDLLVDINDIQALNSAINVPAGQPSPFPGGTFFQLPSTISPTPSTAPTPTFAPSQQMPTVDGSGGEVGLTPSVIDRTLANNFGLTPSGVDAAQQVLGGFGIPGVGIPGVGLGRTFSNLNALNAAEQALGQPETGFLSEVVEGFLPSFVSGEQSLRQRAIDKGDEAARELADKSIRSGATRGTIDAASKRAFGEASRARSISAAASRREQNRARDLENQRSEEANRAASANRAQQERAGREASAARNQAARASEGFGREGRREAERGRERDRSGGRDFGDRTSSRGGRGGV